MKPKRVNGNLRIQEASKVVWMEFIHRRRRHGCALLVFACLHQCRLMSSVFTDGNGLLQFPGCVWFMWVWLSEQENPAGFSGDLLSVKKHVKYLCIHKSSNYGEKITVEEIATIFYSYLLICLIMHNFIQDYFVSQVQNIFSIEGGINSICSIFCVLHETGHLVGF